MLRTPADALHTGRMMLKRRSEKVTYTSVRHVVENMTKREFRVRVCPHVHTPNTKTTHLTREHALHPTQQLLLHTLRTDTAIHKPAIILHLGYVSLLVAD